VLLAEVLACGLAAVFTDLAPRFFDFAAAVFPGVFDADFGVEVLGAVVFAAIGLTLGAAWSGGACGVVESAGPAVAAEVVAPEAISSTT